jgi:hypothetical protein
MRLTAVVAIALLVMAPGEGHAKRGGPTTDDYMPIATCPDGLARPVDGLLRPVLVSLAKWRWSRRFYDATFDRELHRLLQSKHPRALEAQVALLAYYLGERAGDELVAHILSRGAAADELVQRYKSCRPYTSFEGRLSAVQTSATKYAVFEEERRGKRP